MAPQCLKTPTVSHNPEPRRTKTAGVIRQHYRNLKLERKGVDFYSQIGKMALKNS